LETDPNNKLGLNTRRSYVQKQQASKENVKRARLENHVKMNRGKKEATLAPPRKSVLEVGSKQDSAFRTTD